MKRLIHLLVLIMLLSLLTGCGTQSSTVPMNYRWANVEGGQLSVAQKGEEFYFNISVDKEMIESAVPVKIKVSGNVDSGSLRFELRRPDGLAVWDSGTIGPGDFSISTEYTLPPEQTGTYKLGLVYSDNTSATYNLGWHAIQLGPIIMLPGIGMILVSVVFVIYAARRRLLGWRSLGLGALFWVITVVAKFAFAIPVNPLVYKALGVTSDAIFSPGNLVVYLYIGALTGIFEVGLAYLILRKTSWGKATREQALVFGIGFGVIEAFLLGVIGTFSALAGLLAPDALPLPALGSLANNSTFLMGLAPVVERLAVIFAHIFSCVLIFYTIASNETKWMWYAVLYKTLLDAPAGFANFWGVETLGKLWTIEAIVAVFGLIGLWGTIQIARRYPSPVMTDPIEK